MLADELALVVRERPGATVADLTLALRSAGVQATEALVHRTLYAAHGRFRCDLGTPPRWWPAGSQIPVLAPAADPPSPVPGSLHAWQAEALDVWRRRGRRGVVEAVTGTGKTIVGVAAVLEQLAVRGQSLVLVPTRELQRQWIGVLAEWLPARTLVGRLGDGGRCTLASHDVLVAIVNSVRSADVRPIRPHGLLVADECHRYASALNRLALDPRFDRRLGLSATYARDDDGHVAWLDPYFGGTCFELGYRRAIADGVVARVAVALVAVRFEPDERERYDELTEVMRAAAAKLIGRYGLPREPFAAFLREVIALAEAGEGNAATLARRYKLAATERRRLLADARGKTDALDALAPAIQAADRTIVFTQSIAASEAAVARLSSSGIPAELVHSRLRPDVRSGALRRFASGVTRVVSAPKVLDEGVDVPAADLAVIVGASRSRRQMIQRMGRVLRRKPDGRLARFAVLFVEGTVEDPARGAHEGFLTEVTDVADAVERYPPEHSVGDVIRFLGPTAPQGAVR